jgi:hypothetical protein
MAPFLLFMGSDRVFRRSLFRSLLSGIDHHAVLGIRLVWREKNNIIEQQAVRIGADQLVVDHAHEGGCAHLFAIAQPE